MNNEGWPTNRSSLMHGERAMKQSTTTYVAMDTHKKTISIAIAEGGRRGETRFMGEIPTRPEAVAKMVDRLAKKHGKLSFCYEAGPCGYGLYRQITALGHECVVVAPSLVPTRPGDRVKTDRRDAVTQASLLRSGELTPVWVPDDAHEAMRDLSAPGKRRWRCCGARVSRCWASFCDMGAFIPAASIGRASIGSGSRRNASSIRRDKSPSRNWCRRWTRRKLAAIGWPSKCKSFCPPGRLPRSSGHPGLARDRHHCGHHSRCRDRRLQALRQSAPAHGLSGADAKRTLVWRQDSAWRHHQGR